MFELFKRELSVHGAGDYHRPYGRLERAVVDKWLCDRRLEPPNAYLDFLCEVGPGRFFSGNLTIFPLEQEPAGEGATRSVESELVALREAEGDPTLLPFGYDGTTAISYCVVAHSRTDGVYLFSWETGTKRRLAPSFAHWIGARPRRLFNASTYRDYEPLKDTAQLEDLMKARAAFSVRLIRFDPVRRRRKPDDFIPRYHEVILQVVKTRPAALEYLTVVFERTGSQVGAINQEYVSLPVADLALNVVTIVKVLVFDPFNTRFDDIALRFEPVVDLKSPTRSRFKELAPFL
jgi:hypothetical protein